MIQIFTSIIVCFAAISAMAQNNVAVEYDVTTRDSDSGKAYTQKMALVASPEKSLYFDKMSLYVDSCESTPEGKAKRNRHIRWSQTRTCAGKEGISICLERFRTRKDVSL